MDNTEALAALKKYRAWIKRESNDMPDPEDIDSRPSAVSLSSRRHALKRDNSAPSGQCPVP